MRRICAVMKKSAVHGNPAEAIISRERKVLYKDSETDNFYWVDLVTYEAVPASYIALPKDEWELDYDDVMELYHFKLEKNLGGLEMLGR